MNSSRFSNSLIFDFRNSGRKRRRGGGSSGGNRGVPAAQQRGGETTAAKTISRTVELRV